MPLYAPARPYAPVSKRVLLDEPGRRGVSPPPLNIIFKNVLKIFTPHPQKSATKSFSRHSKRFVPGRPWTPLDAPVSKYYFFKCSQNFHPPLPKSTAKSFSSHFKRFVLGRPCTPLYAPTPLCQNAFCLTSPGAGACHPPL